MFTLKPWREIEGMYSIKTEDGETVGTFRNETREEYNSILTIYTDANHTLTPKNLIDLANFIQEKFGEEKDFALLTSDLIYQ